MGRDGDSTRVCPRSVIVNSLLTIYRNYDEGIRVMQRAAAVPKNPKINYHDHVRRIFSLLFKG